MEALLALKQIFLGAIPTFILVWILFIYITRIFVRPLEKTLQKRQEAIVGLRKVAEADLARAEQKTAQYQEALRSARAEVYRIQEQERQSALDQRAEVVRHAHQRAEETAARARQDIQNDVENAKKNLATDAQQIALQIMQAILKPAAAQSTGAAPPGGSEAAS